MRLLIFTFILTIISSLSFAQSQVFYDKYYDLPGAPEKQYVLSVCKHNNSFFFLSDGKIALFDGEIWNELDIELNGDEIGITTVDKDIVDINSGDIVAYNKYGFCKIFREDEFGYYEMIENLYLKKSIIDQLGDGLFINDITFFENRLVLKTTRNMQYKALVLNGEIVLIGNGVPVD